MSTFYSSWSGPLRTLFFSPKFFFISIYLAIWPCLFIVCFISIVINGAEVESQLRSHLAYVDALHFDPDNIFIYSFPSPHKSSLFIKGKVWHFTSACCMCSLSPYVTLPLNIFSSDWIESLTLFSVTAREASHKKLKAEDFSLHVPPTTFFLYA